jgi:hypothetical protein
MQAKADEEDEEGEEGEDEEEGGATWRISTCEIQYNFESSDLPTVMEKVHELEAVVGQYMEGYRIVQEDQEYVYEYTVPPNVPDLALLARLCLGRQILHCLQTTGACSFHAET